MRGLIEEWHSESYLAGRNQVFEWIENWRREERLRGEEKKNKKKAEWEGPIIVKVSSERLFPSRSARGHAGVVCFVGL